MRPATFTIDTFSEHVFAGFTKGETWNGWARPLFTYDEAQKIITAHKKLGLNASYDQELDAFTFKMAPSGDDHDIFPGIEIENMKLYPVGAGCWIWEEGGGEGQPA